MNEDFSVKPASNGIGSSASIYKTLRQFWGGGSRTDDYTPITMGMFAISKYWWNMGQMDPALQIWGGENVEISFRTWLCGGRIVVARDSFIPHKAFLHLRCVACYKELYTCCSYLVR